MDVIKSSNSQTAAAGLAVICTEGHRTAEFSLHGELNIVTAPHLEAAVARAYGARFDRIVIDIGPLAFLDLVGFHALQTISDGCAETETELAFRGVPAAQVRRILSLVGATGRLGI